jgi:hypothetical protein
MISSGFHPQLLTISHLLTTKSDAATIASSGSGVSPGLLQTAGVIQVTPRMVLDIPKTVPVQQTVQEAPSVSADPDDLAAFKVFYCTQEVDFTITTTYSDYSNDLSIGSVTKDSINITGFNSSLGTLDSVDVYMTPISNDSWGIENTLSIREEFLAGAPAYPCSSSASAFSAGLPFFEGASDTIPMFTVWNTTLESGIDTGVLPVYDGTIDFGGTSGVRLTNSTSDSEQGVVTYTDAPHLSFYTGSTVTLYFLREWNGASNGGYWAGKNGAGVCIGYGGFATAVTTQQGATCRNLYHYHSSSPCPQ